MCQLCRFGTSFSISTIFNLFSKGFDGVAENNQSEMELFKKISKRLKAVDCFRRRLRLRCLIVSSYANLLKDKQEIRIITLLSNLIIDSGVYSSLHPNCHHQIVYAKCNWEITYPLLCLRDVWHYKYTNIELIRRAQEHMSVSEKLLFLITIFLRFQITSFKAKC